MPPARAAHMLPLRRRLPNGMLCSPRSALPLALRRPLSMPAMCGVLQLSCMLRGVACAAGLKAKGTGDARAEPAGDCGTPERAKADCAPAAVASACSACMVAARSSRPSSTYCAGTKPTCSGARWMRAFTGIKLDCVHHVLCKVLHHACNALPWHGCYGPQGESLSQRLVLAAGSHGRAPAGGCARSSCRASWMGTATPKGSVSKSASTQLRCPSCWTICTAPAR